MSGRYEHTLRRVLTKILGRDEVIALAAQEMRTAPKHSIPPLKIDVKLSPTPAQCRAMADLIRFPLDRKRMEI